MAENAQRMVEYSLDDLMMRVKNFKQLQKMCSKFFVLPKTGYRKRYFKQDLEKNRIPRLPDLPPIIEERYPNILTLKKDALVQRINASNYVFSKCSNKIVVREAYDSNYLRRVLVKILPDDDVLLSQQVQERPQIVIPEDFKNFIKDEVPFNRNRRPFFLGQQNNLNQQYFQEEQQEIDDEEIYQSQENEQNYEDEQNNNDNQNQNQDQQIFQNNRFLSEDDTRSSN